ncbi:MAG: hypothetical protein WKF72_06370 [Nocardioidaceae bacterium]
MPGRSRGAALCAVLLAVSLSACGITRGDDSQDLHLLIPNSPGGERSTTAAAQNRR